MSQYLDKDGATRIAENFLSKQAEQDVILRNLQFDLKEAEHALVKTVQGPAPLNIRALSRQLDDYLISGNTVQNGTPAPEAPVDVVGCGVRTGNLFDIKKVVNNNVISVSGATITKSVSNYNNDIFSGGAGASAALTTSCMILEAGTYTLSYETIESVTQAVFLISVCPYTSETMLPETQYFDGVSGKTFVLSDKSYVTLRIQKDSVVSVKNVMLNTGSTALPYEPYGFKLPLTVNGTEYPIYLGQVESTRWIKKLVLTGEEVTWGLYVNNRARFVVSPRDILNSLSSGFVISDRYNSTYSVPQLNNNSVENAIAAYEKKIYIYTNGDYDIDNYKSYLAAQYAAGTPVTVWYVLAKPETGIVNEPLHKISGYADTISMAQAGVEISTTKGVNTITTDTTVLPSNIEVKGVINNA